MGLKTEEIEACFGILQSKQQIIQFSQSYPVAVLGTAQSPSFSFSFDFPPIDFLPFEMARDFFALKVGASNMEPLARPNDYLLFRRQRYAAPDDIVLVKEGGQFMVKKAGNAEDILGILTFVGKRP